VINGAGVHWVVSDVSDIGVEAAAKWQECRHEVGSANSVATKTLQLMDGDAMTVSQVNGEFVKEKVEK
jgi:hypothetical protein